MSSQTRFELDHNNWWVVGNSDGTISVVDGPDIADPIPNDSNLDVSTWPQEVRIGLTSPTRHRELQVFGVVISGQKLEELSKIVYDHQVTVNREGFMVQWINSAGGGDKGPKAGNIYRRLNDLYDWTKHGVQVPLPVQTEWDRYQLTTGELMVDVSSLSLLPKVVEELEAELQTLRDDSDFEIRELQKQLLEKSQGGGGGQAAGGGKEKEIADKDKMIDTLKAALKLFL